MRKYSQLAIGLLISAFFIYLILPSLHLADVFSTLQTANYWWILPGIMVYFGGLWVRSWRWHYTLRHLKQIPVRRLFPLVCIGYFGNNVYPLRAGEVIRSYVLRQREQVAVSSSLATVIIERVFDGLTMLLFVFLALPFAPMPVLYRNLVAVLTVLMLVATAVFVWIALRPARVTAVYGWLAARILPARIRIRTDDIYVRFVEGLQSLGNRKDVLMIFGTSIIVWLIETLKYWFVMHAFDFETSFLVLMLMNGLVNLATTLPSAPGYIGTFDAPGIETLAAFGVERNLAASYTFTLHVALWLPVTLVGGYYFWREQLRWADFAAANRQAEGQAEIETVAETEAENEGETVVAAHPVDADPGEIRP
ncbi:MAG: lysylphosphatidylglycerol synthase transmembrane domain-containing protein [Litorilinea sp.]